MISMHHRAGRALLATACAAALLLALLPLGAATGDPPDAEDGSEATDASHGGASQDLDAKPDEQPADDSSDGPDDDGGSGDDAEPETSDMESDAETSNAEPDGDSADAPAAEEPADEAPEEAGDAAPEIAQAPPAPPPAPTPAPAAPRPVDVDVDFDDGDGSTFATSAATSSTFRRDVDLDEDDVLAILALGGGLRHRGLFYDTLGFGSPYSRVFFDDDLVYRPYSLYGYGGLRDIDCIGSECYRVARGDDDRTVVLVVNATSEGRIFDYDSGVRSIRAAGQGVTHVTLDDGTDVLVVRSPPAQPGIVRAR